MFSAMVSPLDRRTRTKGVEGTTQPVFGTLLSSFIVNDAAVLPPRLYPVRPGGLERTDANLARFAESHPGLGKSGQHGVAEIKMSPQHIAHRVEHLIGMLMFHYVAVTAGP